MKEAIKSSGADLGIAHDGDGDRMVAMTAEGRYLGGDLLMQVFARSDRIKKAVAPINISMAFSELLGMENITKTKVGDVFVGEALKENGGDLGCEPSGTWIFPKETLCPDGLLAAAKLIELYSENGNTLFEGLKTYPITREKIELKGPKEDAMASVSEILKELNATSVTDIDGIRADLDWGWILARPSGTEPIIRVTIEAKDDGSMKEKGTPILGSIKGALS